MPPTTSHQLVCPIDDQHRLVVRFFELDERHGHEFVLDSAGEPLVLLRSMDDAVDPPCSPPLQQMHAEPRAESDVVLGVGQSGRNHWSASFEVRHDSCGIDVQLACRVNEPIGWLGSTWQIVDGENSAGTSIPEWILRVGEFNIRITATGVARLNGDPDRSQIQLTPEIFPPRLDLPMTVQWGFRLGVD